MGAELAIPLRTRALPDRTSPSRVLMTADTIGGVWQYALELSRVLIARGVAVTLATMGGLPDRGQRREAASIPGLDLRVSRYKLLWMDEPWSDVHAAEDWLLSIAHELQPDIVHLNDLGHGALSWPAPVLTVGHSCVLSWWRAVRGERAPEPQWTRYRRRVAAGLRASQLVVAPTHAMLSLLQEFYGPLGATRVIGNGRDPRTDPGAKKGIIFSAGRVWDEGKNLQALAAVAAGVPWPVCIAGSARAPDRMPRGERVAFLNVRMLGKLGDESLRRWFGKASIYALPARYEPFGLSVLEAAAAGCALVLGDIDSLRENWEGAALFVPPDDHEALSDALHRLITDDVLRARNMSRARRRAAHLTPHVMADGYMEAYQELHARPRMRRWCGQEVPA